MAVRDFNYDHTKCKLIMNLLPITDLAAAPTFTPAGDDYTLTHGLNDTVQYSKHRNKIYNGTIPMIAQSPQYAALRAFRNIEGDMPFSYVDLNNGETILGTFRIMNLGEKSADTDATPRNVSIVVVAQLEA